LCSRVSLHHSQSRSLSLDLEHKACEVCHLTNDG
jgi:hypothetical protein